MDILIFFLIFTSFVHYSCQENLLYRYLKYCSESGYKSGWRGNVRCNFILKTVPLHLEEQCTEQFKSGCLFSRQTHFCNLGKQNFQQGQTKCTRHESNLLGSESVYDCCVACKLGTEHAETTKNCDQLPSNFILPDQTKRDCCLLTIQKQIDDKNCVGDFCTATDKLKRSEVGIDHEVSFGDKECVEKGYWINPKTGLCEDINECETNQHFCRESEVCENLEGSFKCHQAPDSGCQTGFKKVDGVCKDIDECEDGSHTCELVQKCINYEGSFWCKDIEYTNNWSENLTDPVIYNLTIHNTSSLDSSAVKCTIGYEYNKNFNKCEDIDECAIDESCSGGFKCINTEGSFECVPINCPAGTELNSTNQCSPIICQSGYTLDATLNECMDIDECQTGEYKCTSSEKCKNNEGGFECICKQGYQKDENGHCIDKDECSDNFALCSPQSSVCKNLDGSYKCECKPGFEKDKDNDSCTDIDECQTNNHNCTSVQICDNNEGGFLCIPNSQKNDTLNSDLSFRSSSCPDGFEFNKTSEECEDINECENKEVCEEGTICENKIGTFTCINPQCASGTRLNDCEVIDECQEQVSNCSSLEKCVNSEKGLKCECIKGYERDYKGNCVDEDECMRSMICDYPSVCKNLNGTYECNCLPGFRKGSADDCIDIDECLEKTSNCEHNCFNTYGNFTCKCQSGYKLVDDGKCVDINECEDTDICLDATCINTIGSYECKCAEGFKMTKIGCINRNKECSVKCSQSDGCECSKNFEVDEEGKFQDVDECENNPCPNKSDICINLFGAHKCFDFNCEKNFTKLDKEMFCIKKSVKNKNDSYLESIKVLKIPENYQVPKDGLVLYTMKSPKKSDCNFNLNRVLVNVIPESSDKRAMREDFKLIKDGTSANLILKTQLTAFQDIIVTVDCRLKEYDNPFHRTHLHLMVRLP